MVELFFQRRSLLDSAFNTLGRSVGPIINSSATNYALLPCPQYAPHTIISDELRPTNPTPTQPKQSGLAPPPIAEEDPSAVEVLRVWAAPGRPQELTLRTTWTDEGVWGLVLVDIARHVAQAYAAEGRDPKEVLAPVLELWAAEWAAPTDDPVDATNDS
jgi:hypothetical protein